MKKLKMKPEAVALVSHFVPDDRVAGAVSDIETMMASMVCEGESSLNHVFNLSKRWGVVHFTKDDFTPMEDQYDPEAWNEYPTVRPPENVLMRVCYNHKGKPEKTRHVCLYFYSGKWYWNCDNNDFSTDVVENIRFRPWE